MSVRLTLEELDQGIPGELAEPDPAPPPQVIPCKKTLASTNLLFLP